jgi:glycosyltransferase involved in cell wall biosynthesis
MTNGSTKRADSMGALLPAYNEAENLPDVTRELAEALDARFDDWQILVVDDGSVDETREVMADIHRDEPRISTLRLRGNRGKSEALRSGLEQLDVDLVLLMDADGQDDPGELDALLVPIDAGSDLVTGQRAIRKDRFIKRHTSRLYNFATNRLTGVKGSDFNSGYKLIRRDAAESLVLYGELHRYIPVLAHWAGFRVAEVEVNHRTRLRGYTKFGRNRFWRGMLDLFTVKFITTYDRRPFHLIGGTGLVVGAVGAALLTWMLVARILGNAVGDRPALLAGVTLAVVGVQLVSIGLIAELMVNLDERRRRESRRPD